MNSFWLPCLGDLASSYLVISCQIFFLDGNICSWLCLLLFKSCLIGQLLLLLPYRCIHYNSRLDIGSSLYTLIYIFICLGIPLIGMTTMVVAWLCPWYIWTYYWITCTWHQLGFDNVGPLIPMLFPFDPTLFTLRLEEGYLIPYISENLNSFSLGSTTYQVHVLWVLSLLVSYFNYEIVPLIPI